MTGLLSLPGRAIVASMTDRWMAGPPQADVAVPEVVRALAAGRRITPVWENGLGGLTFEVSAPRARRVFVKWTPAASGLDLRREADRLRWAVNFTRVPAVLAQGADEDGSWMVTAGLVGTSAVSERWKSEPGAAVRAIGEGLRALHEALPVSRCPFSWSVADRLADLRRRLADGSFDLTGWQASRHGHLRLEEALVRAGEAPSVDRLVVCHGDACSPNTLIGRDGHWAGHVDLGALGLGDRWADLAIATWSTEWNFGPGWEELLLDAYGVGPDPERTAYYRLLWDLGP